MNFKTIHIGQMIEMKVTESGIAMSRICNFFKCSENEISEMLKIKSLDSDILLKWCKLLDYDFFRMYTQHLILYSPASTHQKDKTNHGKTNLPQFRKNIYTKEIIEFVLELIDSREKSVKQIIEEYRIPKTTLYKWMNKYRK